MPTVIEEGARQGDHAERLPLRPDDLQTFRLGRLLLLLATVQVHRCALEEIDEPHTIERRPLNPPGDAGSLSSLLLSAVGLEGLRLRQAPTQIESATDPLSFRDLVPLCFLTNQRMDNKSLLLEAVPWRSLKLRQVIEIVFDIHDSQVAALGEQLEQLEERRRAGVATLAALEAFLEENDVPGSLDLSAAEAELDGRLSELGVLLDGLTDRMRAATSYAAETRMAYSELRQMTGEAAARVRDRETLLRRLLPLRGQYAEDERKLVFFQEAEQLFDPLRLRVCPACMQELASAVEVQPGGTCSLCRQDLSAPSEPLDIGAERVAVRARLAAIEKYIQEVEGQLGVAQSLYRDALAQEVAMQRRLDSDVAEDLSPFLAQRDDLVRDREAVRGHRDRIREQSRWRRDVSSRRGDLSALEEQIATLRRKIAELRADRPDRATVTDDLSGRFADILTDFGFPKLNEPEPPYLSAGFVPYVRGNKYSDIGSTGAMTLIALAWQLAIFERAVEQGQPHPGFLMIDSPQKNLMPEALQAGDAFSDPAIPRRVWKHISDWSGSVGGAAQIIVVDNRPPDSVSNFVVRRFSGKVDAPPYGLIDDAVG